MQSQLQRLHSLTNELQSQHERAILGDALKALFERFADNRQIKSILPPPIVYSTKGRPKNTTREKIGLERELEKVAQSKKEEDKVKIEEKKQEVKGIKGNE